ncbi:hypothetical protein CBR_g8980 [Chara braunii]|uniref:Uncharacterized protein n=1 Tax=Chara braunii TaxID=69332 RepID=A0A388KND5_CHABU|nr:hypothetical protein CBR_g8980 [Chara braunii]|eukprot:GBG71564.1 hypothetical protein CBR_g8980 [Chara braunii]
MRVYQWHRLREEWRMSVQKGARVLISIDGEWIDGQTAGWVADVRQRDGWVEERLAGRQADESMCKQVDEMEGTGERASGQIGERAGRRKDGQTDGCMSKRTDWRTCRETEGTDRRTGELASGQIGERAGRRKGQTEGRGNEQVDRMENGQADGRDGQTDGGMSKWTDRRTGRQTEGTNRRTWE